MDRALPLVGLHHDLDPRPDRRAICLHALKPELEPVVSVAGVCKYLVMVAVGLDRAAHHRVDVLGAAVVDVGKGDAMALLQLTEPARGRHVLKAPARSEEHTSELQS